MQNIICVNLFHKFWHILSIFVKNLRDATMTLPEILLLGIALSLDTFAVSLSLGLVAEKISGNQKLRFLLIIGLFHLLMILLGWFVGETASRLIGQFDHWIAFLVLTFVGGKMLFEGFSKNEQKNNLTDLLSLKNTMILGVALSIDALITGFSLGLVSINIIEASQLTNIAISATIIGFCAFIISAAGIAIGKRVSTKIGSKTEIFGGLILIFIGVKILVDHML